MSACSGTRAGGRSSTVFSATSERSTASLSVSVCAASGWSTTSSLRAYTDIGAYIELSLGDVTLSLGAGSSPSVSVDTSREGERSTCGAGC